MKGLRIAALVLLIAVFAFAGYIYVQFRRAEVDILAVTTVGEELSSDSSMFEKNKKQLAGGTFQGSVFRESELINDIDEYVIITYSATIRNGCMLPIEHVELQLNPHAEDIAQIGYEDNITLLPGKTETVKAFVLSKKDCDTVRELILSWYMWGKKFTMHFSSAQGSDSRMQDGFVS